MRHLLEEKRVPKHRLSPLYLLGGLTLFLFLVQVATGVLLMLYYRASTAEAHESVRFIITDVAFGDLVRSVHAWGADLMVGAALAHLFSVWLLKAYRKPREMTWMTGLLLMMIVLGFGFTGYLLPWTETSYAATRVGTEIAGTVPFLGKALRTFLRGGDEIGPVTLSRFFAFHVAILPAAATFLLGAHLLLVQQQGMSVPPSVERAAARTGKPPASIRFFPDFVLRDAIAWLVLMAVVVSLATLVPRDLGVPADPFAPVPAGTKPEWYFLALFEILKLVPATIARVPGDVVAVLAMACGGMFLMLLPFLDRPTARGVRSPAFMALGWLALAVFVGFTGYGLAL
ncbi:MAG TPA: cytochrome bc complex cytochrome b subunit [Myxococcota bacterium]|nr:cytochrome bc complex cytochrome b subunit [Myxococcota bacterium]